MAYNELLADKIRKVLSRHKGITEKKMFGGLAFMLNGHMCCGVMNDDLVVRVGSERYEELVKKPSARQMDFTGKPLKSMVYVNKKGYAGEKSLRKWIGYGIQFTSSLPKKNEK